MRWLITSLDSAAILRAKLGGSLPDLAAMATLARLAGVAAVRVGVNEDGRPIGEADLRDLRRGWAGLELRMTPAPSLVKVALETRPQRVLLASDVRDGSGAPAPLDFHAWGNALAPVVHTLEEAGIEVAVLVWPDLEAVKSAHAADARAVELYTARLVDRPLVEQPEALESLAGAARLAAKLRLQVGIGGWLDARSAARVLEAAPAAEWLAAGRAWTARCMLVGVDTATRDLRAVLG